MFHNNGLLRFSALALVAGALIPVSLAQVGSAAKSKTDNQAAQARMQKASENFVENSGQWNSRAKFLSRTKNMDFWLTKNSVVLDYYKSSETKDALRRDGHVVEMQFVGASPDAKASGVKEARLISQYLGPNADFKKAKIAHSFSEAKITSLYKGVDLRSYVQGEAPRYDLLVAPGANASSIQLRFKGIKDVKIDASGNLTMSTKLGRIEHQDLVAYQMVGGKKVTVEASFVKTGSNSVAYKVGAYDHSKQLVIDPIIYGSYYGGDGGIDEIRAVVADTDGGVFMTGSTNSPDFPITAGPYGVNLSGGSDAFITKFQGDAYSHDYSAYFGGTGHETGKFIALDPSGSNIWICGMTTSNNFPGINAGSYQQTLSGTSDAFLIKFTKDSSQVLMPTYSSYFGSTVAASGEEIKGFAVGKTSGRLFVSGVTAGAGMPNANNAFPGSTAAGYITQFDNTGTVVNFSTYIGGTSPITFGIGSTFLIGNQTGPTANTTSKETGNAMAIDADDNAVVTGTVNFVGNQDTGTAPSPAFTTTASVYPGGRLLKNRDAFIVKVGSNGAVIFSTLLGGADNDFGTSVTADSLGNVYVVGNAGSFDFPRTRDTFGQDFSEGRVFLTKISSNGSQIIYSTSLKTHGQVWPTGVAVDQRGFAFITGVMQDMVFFPVTPADPNQPSGPSPTKATIPVTPDAIRTANAYPAPPDMSASDAWLIVMNDTASSQLYGTYIGGLNDDYLFSPYTDRFGDVWVMGWTDITRFYQRISSDGNTINTYNTSGGIAPFITPLAFKGVGGGQPTTAIPMHYGDWAENLLPFGAAPATVSPMRARDGFVLRFRIDTPIIQTITLNPAVIPGGSPNGSAGAPTSVATVTLNVPATGAGVDVVMTLSDPSAASFDSQSQQGTAILNIPAGQTVGTITIYSEVVSQSTQVDVKAEYLGNFKISRLTVVPWLQKFILSPNGVVGGNTSTGVVTLSAPAPAGGVEVSLLTNDSTLVSFPNGATLTIPEGQTFGNFVIQTNGVDVQTDATVSVSLLGVGITQTLTLRQASLLNVTFSPNRVAGGSASTGTVKLDGKPGPSGFTVDLTINNGTPGYSINPTTLTFGPNDTQKTFTVNTVPEPANTSRIITATRPAQGTYSAQSVSGTLFVDANFLVNMTLNPTTINSAGTSTGTVTISTTAQAGGVVVNLSSSDTNVATVPATVVIPAGSTSASFTVTGKTVATTSTAVITASRGTTTINRTITVRGVTFSITANPTSVIGGSSNITGTITLASAAPAGGVLVSLTSTNSAAASVPATVTVPGGATSVNFTITTSPVATTTNVTITGQTQPGTTASVTVQIRAVQIANLILSRTVVKGGVPSQYPTATVTLDGPAPAGGVTVVVTSSNTAVIGSFTLTVPAGQTTSNSVTVPVARVNRTIAVTLSAGVSGGGATVQKTVTVIR